MTWSSVVLFCLFASIVTAQVPSDFDETGASDEQLLFCSMNLPLRLKIIAENKKFIENRMTKGDYSVAYSVYLDMHRDVFAKYLTLQDLRYTDRKDDLSSEVTDTDKKTWAETAEQIAALQTPLDLSTSQYGYHNHYVIYGAIDLMNLVYTRQYPDDGIKVVLCLSIDV